MTLQEILNDIKSDRVKKVIFDCDAGNEIDDQYALAYALSCSKLEVLGVTASQFENTALVPTREAGMIEGYNEAKRVLKLIGREDVPVYYGYGAKVDSPDHDERCPDVIPGECEGVDFIIETAKAAEELLYVLVTGCATNISSAIAKDPTIKDKICVVWMGSNVPDSDDAAEFNLCQDLTAGRYLLNCGVNLVWIPTISEDKTKGSQTLITGRAFFEESFADTDEASRFFRCDLPREHDGGYDEEPETWWHIFWDVAAPAVLETPELCKLEIVTVPRIRGDVCFNYGEEGRPEAILLEKFTDPKAVLCNMAKGINKIIASK